MERCDICTLPRAQSRVSTIDVHEAVTKGFDPVGLNLLPLEPGSPDSHESARRAWDLAMQSETDWDVCDDCLQHLTPYLPFATRSRLGLVPGESARHTPNNLLAMVEEKMRERGFAPGPTEGNLVSLPGEVETKPETKKACFIATAACGPDSHEVLILRGFRDTVLVDYRPGRAVIRGYEQVGPPLARWIEPWGAARWLVRTALVRPVAWLVELRWK